MAAVTSFTSPAAVFPSYLIPDDAVADAAASDARELLLVRLRVVDSPQMMLLMSAYGQPHTPADTYRR